MRAGNPTISSVTVNLSRGLLAACLIFSGFVKAVDPVGTQIKLQDYLSAFSINVFQPSDVLLAACVLAGFEFLLGIYLLWGIFSEGTAVVTLVVFLLFTPLTLYLALKNPVSDCGCFGDALVLTNWQTFWKNVFLLILAVILVSGSRLVIPFISERRAWAVSVITVLLIGHFMTSNIRDLPVFDFRPYKSGTDLRTAVLEGRDDSFSDFVLLDRKMVDVTDDILSENGYVFLIVAPHLENASQENIDRLNDLYYYCHDNGYSVYCVTSSTESQISHWADITCADYDFLLSDEIPLQTMIRSNPGVVVLNDGVIVAKWSDGNIPIDFDAPFRMEYSRKGFPLLSRGPVKALTVTLYFVLPYLLLLFIDMAGRKLERFRKESR